MESNNVDEQWRGIVKKTLAIVEPYHLNPFKHQRKFSDTLPDPFGIESESLHFSELTTQMTSTINEISEEKSVKLDESTHGVETNHCEQDLGVILQQISAFIQEDAIAKAIEHIDRLMRADLSQISQNLQYRDLTYFIDLLNNPSVELEVKCFIFSSILRSKVETSDKIWPRSFIGEISKFTANHPQLAINELIVPLLKSQALNKYIVDFIQKLIKTGSLKDNIERCLSSIIKEKVHWNDHVCVVLESLVSNDELTPEVVKDFSIVSEDYSLELSKSLKFGSLICSFIKHNGNKLSKESAFHVERTVSDMTSSLKKSAETALKNI